LHQYASAEEKKKGKQAGEVKQHPVKRKIHAVQNNVLVLSLRGA